MSIFLETYMTTKPWCLMYENHDDMRSKLKLLGQLPWIKTFIPPGHHSRSGYFSNVNGCGDILHDEVVFGSCIAGDKPEDQWFFEYHPGIAVLTCSDDYSTIILPKVTMTEQPDDSGLSPLATRLLSYL